MSLTVFVVGAAFAADNCGYKSDGNFHCEGDG